MGYISSEEYAAGVLRVRDGEIDMMLMGVVEGCDPEQIFLAAEGRLDKYWAAAEELVQAQHRIGTRRALAKADGMDDPGPEPSGKCASPDDCACEAGKKEADDEWVARVYGDKAQREARHTFDVVLAAKRVEIDELRSERAANEETIRRLERELEEARNDNEPAG